MLCRILFVIIILNFDFAKIEVFLLSAINSNIFHQKSYEIKDYKPYLIDSILKTVQ